MRKSKAFEKSIAFSSWKSWFAFVLMVTVMGIAAHASGRKVPSLLASIRGFASQEAIEFDPYDVRGDIRDHASNDTRSHVETGL